MSLAALASVVECIQPVLMFQIASVTVTVTDIDMNRDGTPDVLQRHQIGSSGISLKSVVRHSTHLNFRGPWHWFTRPVTALCASHLQVAHCERQCGPWKSCAWR